MHIKTYAVICAIGALLLLAAAVISDSGALSNAQTMVILAVGLLAFGGAGHRGGLMK